MSDTFKYILLGIILIGFIVVLYMVLKKPVVGVGMQQYVPLNLLNVTSDFMSKMPSFNFMGMGLGGKK